jgi:hypothetical protein
MSLFINDDLIWVSIPRCASTSIERGFFESNLNVKHYYNNFIYDDNAKHYHIQLKNLHNKFGKKESICIKRNFFDKWISGLQHMFLTYKMNNIETIVNWEDVDNEFIYSHFTPDYVDEMYSVSLSDINDLKISDSEYKEVEQILSKLTNKLTNNEIQFDKTFVPHKLLVSSLYWTNNNKCTYEFDISEIDKFEKFISNRYGDEFELKKLNQSPNIDSKIVKDDKLKNWVFNNFEKRFVKSNRIL